MGLMKSTTLPVHVTPIQANSAVAREYGYTFHIITTDELVYISPVDLGYTG